MLLVGPPGAGKTHFARRLGELAGCGNAVLSFAGVNSNAELAGNPRRFHHQQPRFPACVMQRLGTAKPVIVIDEVEKAATGDMGDPVATLLGMLERSTAAHYCMGIRSERRLCGEVHLNLAYRWFCRLGLDGDVPDHSTYSKNHHGRFRDSDLLRQLFEMSVARCVAEGLVGGEGFAVDASLIRADVHRQRSVAGEQGLPPEAVDRAVAEYLDVLDDAAFGGATPVTPKRINLTDPASRWTAATREAAFYAYSTNYLIDLDHAVIVDVEATTSVRQAEVTAQRRMIERTQARFGIWPERLVADAAYGSAPNLAWLFEDMSIEPHFPVFDKSARNDCSFERADFGYDHDDDSYICASGSRARRPLLRARARPPSCGRLPPSARRSRRHAGRAARRRPTASA